MRWYEIILYVCSGIITVSGAMAVIWKYMSKSIKNYSDDLISKAVSDATNEIKDDFTELKQKLDAQIEESKQYSKRVDDAIVSIAGDRINQAYNHYMQKGQIDMHSLFTLEGVYQSYVSAGGNHFTSAQMNELRQLSKQNAKQD